MEQEGEVTLGRWAGPGKPLASIQIWISSWVCRRGYNITCQAQFK